MLSSCLAWSFDALKSDLRCWRLLESFELRYSIIETETEMTQILFLPCTHDWKHWQTIGFVTFGHNVSCKWTTCISTLSIQWKPGLSTAYRAYKRKRELPVAQGRVQHVPLPDVVPRLLLQVQRPSPPPVPLRTPLPNSFCAA